ncbi:MAG: 30S ribosomal protein S9 [Candidatus Omnitrophica bacterium]|nr:30S ribosomal protein S9 [Candidatus Omnitrophota bacterium]
MAEQTGNTILGIGRRKTSSAVVRLKEGKGKIIVNEKDLKEYFPISEQNQEAVKPLTVSELAGKFDADIKVSGGGMIGQVDAIKLGIARALVKHDPSLISQLREHGLLTRDPRMKERKKYGQKGARKKFQWTKR